MSDSPLDRPPNTHPRRRSAASNGESLAPGHAKTRHTVHATNEWAVDGDVLVDGSAARHAVEIIHWPRDAFVRDRLARANVPRLLLVEGGSRPPVELGLDEDWTLVSADLSTVEKLASRLRERVEELVQEPALLDGADVLHRGHKSIALNS